MPIFGDKSRFAIQYELDENFYGEWLYGRCYFWCNNMQLAKSEGSVTLRDVLFGSDRIQWGRPRSNPRFTNLSASEAFNLLNTCLYGFVIGGAREELSEELEEASNNEQWLRHYVTPEAGNLYSYRLYLLEESDHARLIFSKDPFNEVDEFILNNGEFDAILDEFRMELDNLYNQNREIKET